MLPGNKIPVAKLPITAHITNAVSYHRKHERRDMSRNEGEDSLRLTKDEEVRFQLEQFARS